MYFGHESAVPIISLADPRKEGPSMRYLLWAVLVLALMGCDYKVSLTEKHGIEIDPAVLGLWTLIADGDQPPDTTIRLLTLQYSATEYLIHYPISTDGLYYRLYPVKIRGMEYVQTPISGDMDGPPSSDDN